MANIILLCFLMATISWTIAVKDQPQSTPLSQNSPCTPPTQNSPSPPARQEESKSQQTSSSNPLLKKSRFLQSHSLPPIQNSPSAPPPTQNSPSPPPTQKESKSQQTPSSNPLLKNSRFFQSHSFPPTRNSPSAPPLSAPPSAPPPSHPPTQVESISHQTSSSKGSGYYKKGNPFVNCPPRSNFSEGATDQVKKNPTLHQNSSTTPVNKGLSGEMSKKAGKEKSLGLRRRNSSQRSQGSQSSRGSQRSQGSQSSRGSQRSQGSQSTEQNPKPPVHGSARKPQLRRGSSSRSRDHLDENDYVFSKFSLEAHQIMLPAVTNIGIFGQLGQGLMLSLMHDQQNLKKMNKEFCTITLVYAILAVGYFCCRLLVRVIEELTDWEHRDFVCCFVDECMCIPLGLASIAAMSALFDPRAPYLIGSGFLVILLCHLAASVTCKHEDEDLL